MKKRNEETMMKLILDYAINSDRVSAVFMNGSRTNPNAPKDCYMDYDIVYVTDDVEYFINDKSFISHFGKTAIIQEPDSPNFGWEGSDLKKRYGYLMLFEDGNRIDLSFLNEKYAQQAFDEDSLRLLLLDKRGLIKDSNPTSDINYYVTRPTIEKYKGCCNEFWWCLNNVAKGIARDEVGYYLDMYNRHVRDMLMMMIEWHIGFGYDYKICTGKNGKYFKNYLDPQHYSMFVNTYCGKDDIQNALSVAFDLFSELAQNLGEKLGFEYNYSDEKAIREYFEKVLHN